VSETSFGRYHLLELLGEGGMGQVYRAYDTETDRIVALKVLPPELVQNRMFGQRFKREAQTAAALNDPHIVPIHHYGEIDGRLYVDMRLIEGRDLAQLLNRTTEGLDPATACDYVGQLAEALHAAHQAGLVHRDVKPSNVLVTDRDFVYLIDFGIAQSEGRTRLTQSGVAIGTFAYMAPERLSSGIADSRSDVYSLACVLYECLTGRPPFSAKTVEQFVAAHLMAEPPRPSALRKEIAQSFDVVVAKGMAKVPERRYQSTLELAAATREALAFTNEASSIAINATRLSDGLIPPQPGGPDSAARLAFHAAETMERSPSATPRTRLVNPAKKTQPRVGATGNHGLQTPRQTSRARPRPLTVVIVSVVGLLLLTGAVVTTVILVTDRGATIKPDGAAQSVFDLVSKQTGFKPNDVTCPGGVEAQVDSEFECHFTGPEGKHYTAKMKVTKIVGDDVEFYIQTAPS
jgi:serine/threonine-protein kinase